MFDTNKGIIAWFARNPVAANLLMVFLLVGGFLSAFTISKQMFPQVEINWIDYSVSYPGAAPQEVEEGITIKIEEAIENIQGLDRVITTSKRNRSQGRFRVDEDYDPQVVLEEVKAQIDAIPSFPEGMERPVVTRRKFRQEVLYISLYGDLEPVDLKVLGQTIYDEIQQLPLINVSEYYAGLDYEISIEVSKDKLREYDLSFKDIANAVRQYSRNMSAGQIRTSNGYINLRVENQAYRGYEFEKLPLITRADGTRILLSDVAEVNDGFKEGLQYSKFNGKNSRTFFIGAAENQSITDIAEIVKKYVDDKSKDLPQGVKLETWVDFTYYLDGRLNMMLDNMKSGAILVFLLLALFLRIRLAFWVMMGLPVCFLGTLLVMPLEMVDITINVVSLFAFILVLGIVVDDAIVMGESAHAEVEAKGHSIDNVIRGVQRVAVPATFGVLTTIAAFFPLVLGEGPMSAFSKAIGGVVIFCLIFSLIESKLILPAHLAHMKVKTFNPSNPLDRARRWVDTHLQTFIEQKYKPFLALCLTYRYAVLTTFLSILLICGGVFLSDFIRFIGQPKVPHDFPQVTINMNLEASEEATLETALTVENILRNMDARIATEHGHKMISDMQVELRGQTKAILHIKLVEPELRPMNTFALADLWRNEIPPLPGVKDFSIQDSLFGNREEDGDISFKLQSKNDEELVAAAQVLKDKLNSLEGVGDVNDSRESRVEEVRLKLKPLAYSLGLTLSDVASQVNYSFYGLEAQRILRDTEEIRVMVRYPHEQRKSVNDVDTVMIQTSKGKELPLSEVAEIYITDGVNRIRREDGSRTIKVWAQVNTEVAEPFKITKDIRKKFLPQMLREFPLVKASVSGKIEEEIENNAKQLRDFIVSLMVIFTLLAVPLRSYIQPFMIMIAIPFGVVGALLGHLLLGMDLNNLSVFGIIAAAGVVVNDSLVMVDYINNLRREGYSTKESVLMAGTKRFRAIMLTSITTFVGLVPIIFFETSMQALIVIPMAVSLSFGVMFATVVTLLLIPAIYVIIDDLKQIWRQRISALYAHN